MDMLRLWDEFNSKYEKEQIDLRKSPCWLVGVASMFQKIWNIAIEIVLLIQVEGNWELRE
jgi:hypothetical protein